MRTFLLGSAFAMAIVAAAPAVAVPTIIYTPGDYSLPSYTTATVYQTFNSGAEGATYVPTAGESTTGTVKTYLDTVTNQAEDPQPSDTSAYLAIQNGTYTTNFSTPAQVFSFVFGSLDSYNSLSLTFADSSTLFLQGAAIVGGSSGVSGRVTYDLGGAPGITSATFGSSKEAFEIDSLASAVPEASTWSMMLLGMGLIGGQLRTRNRRAGARHATA